MTDFFEGNKSLEKPCPVKARQGFSILYRQRYLYSKYAPEKAILKTISEMTILEESLILAFSPCLWYGLKELTQKICPKSIIVGIEEDENLFTLALDKLRELENGLPQIKGRVFLCRPSQFEDLIKKIPPLKRALALEMSGGTFFYKDTYSKVFIFAQDYVSAFWKNRVTLVKLGRLFCKNLFKNLKKVPKQNSLPLHSKLFNRPFLIFGAGESAETFITKISRTTLDKCTIIAVDAALPLLLKHGIKVDFVVAVEAQLAIEKAYIGLKPLLKNTILLTDLSSRPSIINLFKNRLYFYSEFDRAKFFNDLNYKKILPQKITALGSVGLTAVELALLMRVDENVPIFVAGLDFSFSVGFTHARGAPAHTQRLLNTNRLTPIENYNSSFKSDSKRMEGKTNQVITDTALLNYAKLFRGYFDLQKNLFDAGQTGLFLNLALVKPEQIDFYCKDLKTKKEDEFYCLFSTQRDIFKTDDKKAVDSYIQNEILSLTRIKELLSKGENANPKPQPSLEEELKTLLECREYLYLHFADGYRFDIKNLSILKRIRSEIDFFLKNLNS